MGSFFTSGSARTHFAAGALLDLHVSSFGFVLNPKNMFWGPWIRFFGELFVVVSGCFFRHSTWRCSKSPRKKIASVPPCLRMFLVLLTDASVGIVLGGYCKNNFRQQFKDKLLSLTFLSQALSFCSSLGNKGGGVASPQASWIVVYYIYRILYMPGSHFFNSR